MEDNGYYDHRIMDFWLQKAIHDIQKNYGHVVSLADKHKDLLKFGRNELVGTTRATLMDLPAGILHETLLTDNLITKVSSSSASDTRTLTVEGHTLTGGDLTFVTQIVTLTGQTQATLTTPLARVSRMYAPDGDTTDLVGVIYGTEDDTVTAGVPDTDTKVHIMIDAGQNQSHKCATSISSTDYWIVMDFDADCYEKGASFAEVRLEKKKLGGVWRPAETLAVSAGNHSDHGFKPYHIVKPNTDVRLTAVADGVATDVGGMVQGTLAKIK